MALVHELNVEATVAEMLAAPVIGHPLRCAVLRQYSQADFFGWGAISWTKPSQHSTLFLVFEIFADCCDGLDVATGLSPWDPLSPAMYLRPSSPVLRLYRQAQPATKGLPLCHISLALLMCLFSVSCFTHLLFSKFPLETCRLPHLHRAKRNPLGQHGPRHSIDVLLRFRIDI